MVSPRSKVAAANGVFRAMLLTPGGPWLPSTLWFAAVLMAFVPKPRLAACVASRASLIVPLFSVSAAAAMSMPFVSVSPARTV